MTDKVAVQYRLSEKELTYLFFWEYYRARGKTFWSVFRLVGGPLLIGLSTLLRFEDKWFRSGEHWPDGLPPVNLSLRSTLFGIGVYLALRPVLQSLMRYVIREKLHEAKREMNLTLDTFGLTLRNGEGVTSQIPWVAVASFGSFAKMAWFEFSDGLRIFVPCQVLEKKQEIVFRLLREHGRPS